MENLAGAAFTNWLAPDVPSLALSSVYWFELQDKLNISSTNEYSIAPGG
jgi:hypothetical protein